MNFWLLLLVAWNVNCIDFRYHSHEEGTELLKNLNETYPELCFLYSIGTSEQKRELWVLQITENVHERTPGRPRVKSVANMHGDETVGKALMFQLAQFLLEGYQKDPVATEIVNNYDLHLMPSLNPDGFEASREGECHTTGRDNAKRIDLNRNFPDQWRDAEWKVGNTNLKSGRPIATENLAMINWILNSRFVLSLNLHAGSEVASYGWDGLPTGVRHGYSKMPDDDLLKWLAHTYADNHETMHKMDGAACGDPEPSFVKGVTNGANWYPLSGGMEDFNYIYGDCVEITIELTCCKYPKASTLEHEWTRNKNALLAYIRQSDQSVHGFIACEEGDPQANVEITVEGIDKVMHSDVNGDFWRPLVPGQYEVTFSKDGFEPETVKLDVPKGGIAKNITLRSRRSEVEETVEKTDHVADALELQEESVKSTSENPIELDPENVLSENKEAPLDLRAKDPEPAPENESEDSEETMANPESATLEAVGDNALVEEKTELDLSKLTDPEFNPFKHRIHADLTDYLKKITEKYSSISRLYSIGKSMGGRELWVVEVSNNPGEHQFLKPELKLVSAMHGNEASSQTTAVAFITDLVTNYESDPDVKRFVDSHRIHVLSTMNPDGHEIATTEVINDGPHKVDAQTGGYGRDNNDGIDLNRNFPYPNQGRAPLPALEAELVMNWSERMNFVLSLNLHNGGLLANYPYDDNYWDRKTSYGLGRDKKGSYAKCDDDDIFRHLASTYANNHPTMANGKGCEDDIIGIQENPKIKDFYGVERFKGGITNGAEWYEVSGSMQDWNYIYTNTLEVTVEIGCLKYPSEPFLQKYWEANRNSIYSYYSFASAGVTGQVFDVNENPIHLAIIEICDKGVDKPRSHHVGSLVTGDFFRPLLPGSYSVLVHKPGFHNQTETIEITSEKPSVFLKFNLFALTPQIVIEDELMEEEEFLDTTDSELDSEDSESSDSDSEIDSIADLSESEMSNSANDINSVVSDSVLEDLEDEDLSPPEIDEQAQARVGEDDSENEVSWKNENSTSFINMLVYAVTFMGLAFCCIIFYKKRASNSGAGTFQFNKIGVQEDLELRKSLLKNRV